MERVKRPGWIYVLHHDDDGGLALEIKLGLNRLGHQIWVRKRDEPDLDDLKAHNLGISRAAFVVVLETAALANWPSALERVEWAESGGRVFRPKFIRVKVEDGHRISRGDGVVEIPAAADMSKKRRLLVSKIHRELEKLQGRTRSAGAPTGKRGRYVLLSYSANDAHWAANIRENLTKTGIETWDYAVSPRHPAMGYMREIPAAIGKARAVLIVLTAAWLDSDFCLGEADHARKRGRRCLWLRFDTSSPPFDYAPADLIEVGACDELWMAFDQLAAELGHAPAR